MSDTKQTAVEWLIHKLSMIDTRSMADLLVVHKQALAMEREQIESAYSQAHEDGRESTLNDRNYDAFYYERIYGDK